MAISKFFAKAVDVYPMPGGESLIVEFAEQQTYSEDDLESENLQLQGALGDPDEGDENTYCIVNAAQDCSYGSITKCVLTPTEFSVSLSKRGAEEMGTDGFVVRYSLLAESKFGNLKDAVKAIFETSLTPMSLMVDGNHLTWTPSPSRD